MSEQVLEDDYRALRAEVEALRAENGRLRDKYDRDVYGLNNEGDPIGGDPAGDRIVQTFARLRAELEAARAELAASKKKLSVAQQFSPRIIGCNCGEYVPEGYLCACERGIL